MAGPVNTPDTGKQWNTEPYAVCRCKCLDEDCDARDEQENGDNPSGDLHANSSSRARSRPQPPVERRLLVECLSGHLLQTSLSPSPN
jgi:hypothetical protein